MLDFSLQQQLEEQGKDEIRNFIKENLKYDYDLFKQLPSNDNDIDEMDYEIAWHTLKRIFRVLQKAGIKLEE